MNFSAVKNLSSEATHKYIDFDQLLLHFKKVQALHRTHKQEQRKLSIQLWERNK